MVRKRWMSVPGLVALALLFAAQAWGEAKSVGLAEVEAMVARTPEEGGYALIDSRPEIKYVEGHLPWAKSLPWQEMKERLAELPADKGTKIVFYCGGVKCDLSVKAAELAAARGYSDVAVFREGEPGWREAGHPLWVGANYLKMVLNDRERLALIVDSRPQVKYNEGTIPGALNLPFQEWEKRQGLLPADRKIPLIFFCGGLKCDLSFKSAEKARQLGYTDVRLYTYGWPDWEKNSTRAFVLVNPKEGGKGAAASAEPPVNPGEIPKDEFLRLLKEKPTGFLLVDVRPEADFRKGHLPGAVNILDEKIGENAPMLKKHSRIVFYCSTGSRSAAAYYAAEDAKIAGTRYLNRPLDIRGDGSFEMK